MTPEQVHEELVEFRNQWSVTAILVALTAIISLLVYQAIRPAPRQ